MRVRISSDLAIRKDNIPQSSTVLRFALMLGAAAMVAFSMAIGFPAQAAVTEHAVSFENDILPIFETKCIQCHSEGGIADIEHGVILSSYKDLMKKSARGFGNCATPFGPEPYDARPGGQLGAPKTKTC